MMRARELPPLEYLQSVLRYEPDTGKLFWLPRPIEMFPDERAWKIWNTRYADKEAISTPDGRGYRFSIMRGQKILAHRIAWYLGTGESPMLTIDHINGDRLDNRLCNLRHVSMSENMRNRRLNSNSKSGAHGVRQNEQSGMWQATMKVDGRMMFLGSFLTRDEAVACRAGAERALGFHPNHGRS